MYHKRLLKGVAPLLVLFSVQAAAMPFPSNDPRSLAMGGTGVASGTSANAGFMNPALLAAAREGEDFSLEFPIISLSLYDPDKVRKELDAYQNNNLESNFDQSLQALKSTPTPANYAAVATSTQALLDQLKKLSNKALQAQGLVGFTVGIPSRNYGASLVTDARVVAGGLLNINSSDLAQLQTMVDQAQSSTLPQNSYDTFNSKNLTSTLDARGAVIGEMGISLAHEIDIAGQKVAVGVTPKYVRVATFDYAVGLNSASFSTSQGRRDYSNFNLDLGLAKDYGNGWKSGFTVKDLIGHSYETALGNQIKIEPQARVGVSRSTDWVTVALDVDLTSNAPVGYESKTRYAALGAELDLFKTVQLRAGYRHNMNDSRDSMPTVGVGLSPFGLHLDIAAGANQNEASVAMQMGFRF